MILADSDLPNSDRARDRAFHLHPYTNARRHQDVGPHVIGRGDGIHVIDEDGRIFIEAVSGLWCAGLGFSEQRLAEAAYRQLLDLPFYHTFNHRSNRPAIELAEKLVSLAPVPMSKVFFTNSGSEANDTALKLIWYRSNAIGQPQRKKVIVRDRAYHGSTLSAAALTGLPANHTSFDVPADRIVRVRCPHFWREGVAGEDEQAFSERLAHELEQAILAEGPETIAAFFAEPVQGAGGVIAPPAGYWEKVQAVLRRYDILLVVDEVVCGFGRTGQMFGSATFGIAPDIMIVSKQLTSAYLPLAAVLINDKVFEPIASESNRIGTLGHGFTASGHPVCCAVALETIRIIEESDLPGRSAAMGRRLLDGLRKYCGHPLVGEIRGAGLLAAIELVTDKEGRASQYPPGHLGQALCGALLDHGVIVRALNDSIAFCPPMIIDGDQVDDLVERVGRALADLSARLNQEGAQA